MNCTATQWLNKTTCANCTVCSSPSVTALQCTPFADTACRLCTPGFEAIDDACSIAAENTEAQEFALFVLVVLEILMCACTLRWWKRHSGWRAIRSDSIY